MIVYTCQMSSWRKARDRGLPFHDITVKSGDKTFAPSWDLLNRYKSGLVTEEEYTEEYKSLMRRSYKNNKKYWLDFCKNESIVLSCFCGDGSFCHRYILVEILRSVCKHNGIPFTYEGDL